MIPPGAAPVSDKIDGFLTRDAIENCKMNAGTISAWDFSTACGNTISERYEGLYFKINEITNVLKRKGAVGYFWIVTSPEVCGIFESSLRPRSYDAGDYFPMSLKEIEFSGTLANRWRVYQDTKMPTHQLLIGVNWTRESDLHYGRMSIANFII